MSAGFTKLVGKTLHISVRTVDHHDMVKMVKCLNGLKELSEGRKVGPKSSEEHPGSTRLEQRV